MFWCRLTNLLGRYKNVILLNGFLASIVWAVVRGSEFPCLLTALTLKLYLWPGCKPSTARLVTGPSVSPAGTQRPETQIKLAHPQE